MSRVMTDKGLQRADPPSSADVGGDGIGRRKEAFAARLLQDFEGAGRAVFLFGAPRHGPQMPQATQPLTWHDSTAEPKC